jgi:hypothetical protein
VVPAAAAAPGEAEEDEVPFDRWLLQMGKNARYWDLTSSDRACVIWARVGSFLPFEEQEALRLESVVLAKAMQLLMPVWIAVEPPPVPVPSPEGSNGGGGGGGGGGASKTEGELEGELEGGCAIAPPPAKMTLKGALVVFKQFRKKHPKRRFDIRLGVGAHKAGFQVEDEDGNLVPGVVGGGDFRGLNLEGGGWDGLRIKTPEVCAVYGQEGLASIAVLEGVRTIGKCAFSGCSSLASVAFPDALQTIGEHAFSGCTSLASVAFPDALQTIEKDAFKECSSLASVAFPDALQTIEQYAFCRCSSLASVAFPDALQTIGACAFSGCSSLVSVAIPASLSIDSISFPHGCKIVKG